MSKSKDGGPAFPVVLTNVTSEAVEGFDGQPVAPLSKAEYRGMSLRDHFAGLAMQGMWAHPDNCGLIDYQMAERAYHMADIMIMQRGKP